MDITNMDGWKNFEITCSSCTKCTLSAERTQVVIGRGRPETARIIFIGEGPGEQEDQEGRAFVGRAGKLLDLLLVALQIEEEDYYITNIVKCRPPNNREPEEEEIAACMPWLRFQVKAIRPAIIVCLGRIAAQQIIDKGFGISRMRGNWVEKGGFLIMPTWHPAAVLRDEAKKADLFSDIQMVKRQLELIKR